jgi:hypothetical protein
VRGWLLDTNVVSELRRPKPNPDVVRFIDAQPGERLLISEITFAEIRYGIEQLSDADRRADLHHWLQRSLRLLFAGRVLAVTEDVLVRWKSLAIAGQKRGHSFGQPDRLIAAIASLQDLVVVSRDISEYVAADVPVFDPWESALHIGQIESALKAPASFQSVADSLEKSRS